MMQIYEFMLMLDRIPDLDTTDRLYGYFNNDGAAPTGVQDFTLVIRDGQSAAVCTVEASSFDDALALVLPQLRKESLKVVRVELDEQGLAMLQVAV
ncbi:MAG TPA: hypothetical protein P5121_27920 [Caldilineaceae bacterium]|nr:hypothetical protein [Caldilineaceae bacterium]